MIDHVEIQTRNIELTVRFYGKVLVPLGYRQQLDARAKGFGAGDRMDFFVVEGSPSADVHYAFESPTRDTVDAVYAIADREGFTLDRAPALAPHIHPNYYAAYLRDPDGRLVEFVCHGPE